MKHEKAGAAATRETQASIEISAPIEAVWKALTEADELTRWFPLEARVTPGAGGEMFLSWGPDCEGTGRVEVWEPEQRLRWLEPSPAGGEPNAIEWTLHARGGNTFVRVVDAGFFSGADWEQEYFESKNYGWTFMLVSLRHYLQRHAGTPRLVAWPRRRVAVSREEAFARLTAEGGLFAGDAHPGAAPRARSALAGARPGDSLSLRAATGDRFVACVEFVVPPRGFCLTLAELNDALLWLTIEGAPGRHDVQLWLSAYGLPPQQVSSFGERWGAVLEKIFPEASAAQAD